jgi:asparagine N-glycosylation enzyme membrane subunit Stt3
VRARTAADAAARLMFVAASSYASLFGILLWQALRGQSVVQPDGTTIIALAAWAIMTTVAALKAAAGDTRTASQAVAIS